MSRKHSAKQGLRFKAGADLASHRRELRYAIQLMMSRNAVVAAMRWHDMLTEHDTETPIEGLASFVTISGLCGETIRCLLVGQRKGLLRQEMLHGDAELSATWDAIVQSNRPAPVGLLLTIRDNCFGHFDERVAKNFLRKIESTPDRFSFVQTSSLEDPSYKNSWYQWGALAIINHLNGGDLAPEAFLATVKLSAEWVRRIAQLANHLLDRLIEDTCLPTEHTPVGKDRNE